ncbi:hypothetical protein [Pseudorhodobacter antarcticus]|uniref:hypothetical protein n=1 Tax=Pseudorhodobacter antarcticus TaxID=1077947 RepID=UPI0012E1BCAE|nr:hypothetical protein [Pseudorhodobacter antarcticus]
MRDDYGRHTGTALNSRLNERFWDIMGLSGWGCFMALPCIQKSFPKKQFGTVTRNKNWLACSEELKGLRCVHACLSQRAAVHRAILRPDAGRPATLLRLHEVHDRTLFASRRRTNQSEPLGTGHTRKTYD